MSTRVMIIGGKPLLDEVKLHYQDSQVENKGQYIAFFAKKKEVVITAYISKHEGEYKIQFLGENALAEARQFDPECQPNEAGPKKVKAPTKACWSILNSQIGSDEVGTGDLFGPICVAAAYVKKEDIAYLKELGVDDSKRLTDDDIRRIGKELVNKIVYSQVSLDNEKYNEVHEKNINMNEMKAKMHNAVLRNLHEKFPSIRLIVVDQFCSEELYYSYLFGEKNIVQKITFQTKAESYFPCVAAASIIARYSFLLKMDKMGEKYGMVIPFGASANVTTFAKKFADQFGVDELRKVCKLNFANLKEII